MPDYKSELRQAIYGATLKGQDKVDFDNYESIIKDKTIDQYVADVDRQIEQKNNLYDEKLKEYEKNREYIEYQLDDGLEKKTKKILDESFSFEAKNPSEVNKARITADYIVMKENNWAVKYSKGNGKGIDEIATEIEEEINSAKEDGIELNYNETEKFKSFNFEKQVELTGYIDALKRMKGYKEAAPEDAKLIDESFSKYKTGVFAARQQLFDAMENSKEKKELKTLENEISDLKSNKNKMQTYGKEMSKKADSLLVADLKKGAQEKALDMLTKARVEYRNKLNGWQRMWANILPTWMYGNGKYVDKINAYKKTLSEMGFTDKQIEKADPTKDPDYAYNKANGRYVKVKDNSNKAEEKEIEDDTSVKENDVKFILEGQTFTNGSIVPAKDNKTKQQDFQKGLAEVTGNNNKGDVSKTNQKTDNNPKLNNDIKK